MEKYSPIIESPETLIFNLEKNNLFSNKLHKKRYIGLTFLEGSWNLKDHNQIFWGLKEWKSHAKENSLTWGQQLLKLTGMSIEPQYGYLTKKNVEKKYDIGFNWQVGPKWKSKQLPLRSWKEIEKQLQCNYNICWQQGMENLKEYMNWISSCRLIITTDSLGLHLAIAMGIPVISYFSTTSSLEIDHHQLVSFYQFSSLNRDDETIDLSIAQLQKKLREFIE